MSIVKKMILYNVFIIHSVSSLLHCQDQNIENNQDLVVICDSCPEEIYPLDDLQIISNIQNFVHDLEFDSSDVDMQIILPSENTEKNAAVIEIIELPLVQESLSQDPIENNDFNESNESEEALHDQLLILEETEFDIKDIESSLENVEILYDCVGECITISIDNEQDIKITENLIQENLNANESSKAQDEIIIAAKDEIVPVPHNLINSVKKAKAEKIAKKKMKQEKKAKRNFFKKSKKENKKKKSS